MDVSLVVVCHHSSPVLAPCVESFQRETIAAGVEGEVIAVEHSEDEAERRKVEGVGVDRVIERPNRGYAAGLNVGVAEASGEVLFLANPDIRFFPNSVGALLEGIEQGFDVVGPQFVWDDDGRVLLPPAEDPAPRAELRRAMRRRWPSVWKAGLSRSLDGLWRLWTADTTRTVGSLRGALLAAPSASFDRFGPFDEGYFLYYEETEWLWRARRRGARLGLAGGARVQHRWGHATGRTAGAAEREGRSRKRFMTRNYGGLWRRILRADWGGGDKNPVGAAHLNDDTGIPEAENDLWLGSPFLHLTPALGTIGARSMPMPFLDFCRTWRWVVASATRLEGDWRITGAWTWGR
jgi:GT2 family glycosyltransferase